MKRLSIVKQPLLSVLNQHLIAYPTPSNLNYFWGFGSLAGLSLLVQIATGIFLAMHYTPHVDLAFSSVEHIMRDVEGGWLLRYMHANGASMFFIAVYLHMFRVINEINNILDLLENRTLNQISMKDIRPFIKGMSINLLIYCLMVVCFLLALSPNAFVDLKRLLNMLEDKAKEEDLAKEDL